MNASKTCCYQKVRVMVKDEKRGNERYYVDFEKELHSPNSSVTDFTDSQLNKKVNEKELCFLGFFPAEYTDYSGKDFRPNRIDCLDNVPKIILNKTYAMEIVHCSSIPKGVVIPKANPESNKIYFLVALYGKVNSETN